MGALLVIPTAGCLAVLFKKKFEDTAFPAVIMMTGILLLSGMFVTFIPGVFICIAAAAASAVFCVHTFLRDRERLRSFVLTPGFVGFVLLFLFFAVCELGGTPDGKADTWAHWALAIKNYRYFDDIVIGSPSTDRFATYPPALILWDYLSTRLWPRYSEGMALLGHETFYAAALLPVFGCIPEGRHVKRSLAALFLVFLFPLSARTDAYGSLYADAVLAVLIGFCMIQAWRFFVERDGWHLFTLASGLFILGLTKETGVAYAFLFAAAFSVCYIVLAKKDKISGHGGFKFFSALWGGSALAPLLWYGFVYLAPPGAKAGNSRAAREAMALIAGRADGGASSAGLNHVTSILNIQKLFDRFEDWQLETFKERYINGLFTTETYGVSLFFRFSPIAFLILLIILPWLRQRVSGRREGAAAYGVIYSAVAVTAFFDLILMPFMYLSLFPWTEVMYLASFPRYMVPLTFGALWFCIYLFTEESAERDRTGETLRSAVTWLVIFLWLLHSGQLASLPSMLVVKPERTVFWGLEHSGVEAGPGDNFLFINDTDEDDDDTPKFRYTVAPADANRSVFKAQVKDGVDEVTGKNIVHEMTADEFSEKLKSGGYNYLYLNHVDEEFAGRYGEFFAAGSSIGDGKLYGVSWVGETPVLNLLGE